MPLGPEGGASTTSQGHLQHQFERALKRGDVHDAIAAGKQIGRLSLGNALALCVVLAERDPVRFHRASARWLARFVDEIEGVSLEEAQLVSAALAALPTAPSVARPVLRELVRVYSLVTVRGVFQDVIAS
jgi:hypothetical protein